MIMKNRVKVYQDERSNLRIGEHKRVVWSIRDGDIKGHGIVRNISASGMLLETNSGFIPNDGHVFSFDADLGQNNFIPEKGKLVWHKKKDRTKNRHLCGIEFLSPAEYVSSKLRAHVQQKVLKTHTLKRMTQVANGVLIGTVMGLMGYVLWQSNLIFENITSTNTMMISTSSKQAELTQTYSELYKESQLRLASVSDELSATRLALSGVTRELDEAKALLAQTENMLVQAKDGNSTLKKEMGSIQDINEDRFVQLKAELQGKISTLESKNKELTEELVVIQRQMQFYQGDVKNMDEGRQWMDAYKQRMRSVKIKIKEFKKEAEAARIVANKERDRIKSLIGNNGYFVKDGKDVIVDMESYNAASAKALNSPNGSSRSVDIDVKIVE